MKTMPYRLYNGITALNNDSIVLIGHALVTDYFRTTQGQAIWVTAYLGKKLILPSLEDRRAEIALLNAWCRRRYLSNGKSGIWMVFELTEYTDELL
jgi:dimethylaniline monooxygenase (N-oxide forming)